jgi:uncharacterized protein (TIGR02001 family)
MTNSTTLKAVALGAAVAAALSSGIASAELTGNAAITNNYIWRGVTQTSDQAAGQGGLDWGHSSGLYVGTWISNVDFSGSGDGYEMDVYAGFGGEAGGFGYDLGVLTYQYPVTPNFNFTEVYASGTFSVVTIGLNYTVDAASGNDAEKDPTATGLFEEGDLYVYGSLDFPTKAGDISLFAGSYMFDKDGKDFSATGGATVGQVDYVHYGASISKGDFTFAVDKNDIDSANAISGGDNTVDNVRFSVVWSKEFELM